MFENEFPERDPRAFGEPGQYYDVFADQFIIKYISEHFFPWKWESRTVYERIWSTRFSKKKT